MSTHGIGDSRFWEVPGWPSLAKVDPLVKLAAAVLAQAAKDAGAGNPEAQAWLGSQPAALFCEVLGFDHQAVVKKVATWEGRPFGGALYPNRPAKVGALQGK